MSTTAKEQDGLALRVGRTAAPSRPRAGLDLDDPRLPDALRPHLVAARVLGHRVDVFELPGLCRARLCVEVMAPWSSDLGAQLRQHGAHETSADPLGSSNGGATEAFAWYEPDLRTPALFHLLDARTGRHVADGVVWRTSRCEVQWMHDGAEFSYFSTLRALEIAECETGKHALVWGPAPSPAVD